MKNIIKQNNNTDKINEEKTIINANQVEESQKKNITSEKSIEKSINKEIQNTESFVSVRDFSGKIKYDNLKSSSEVITNANNTSNIIKNDDNSGVIKSADDKEAFKHTSNIISDENITNNSLINENSSTTHQNLHTTKNTAYKYKETSNNAVINERKISENIVRSTNANEVVKDNTNVVKNNANVIGQQSTAYRSSSITKNTAFKNKKAEDDIKTAEKQITHSDNTAFRYVENNIAKHKDKTVTIDTKELKVDVNEKKYSESISKTGKDYIISEKKDRNKLAVSNKKSKVNAKFKDNKPSDSIKHSDNKLATYGAMVVKNQIENQIEKSDDEGLKSISKITNTALLTTSTFISGKTTKGNRRKLTYNSQKTAETVKNLGIKGEIKNEIKATLLAVNEKSSVILTTSKNKLITDIKNNVKSNIEELGEDDLAFKAIDDTIKVADGVKNTYRGIKATVNGTAYVNKAFYHTGKSVINAPKTIKATATKFQKQVKKLQKISRMKKAHKIKYIGKTIKGAVKVAISALQTATKAVVLKFLAILILILLIVIIVAGAVVAIIGQFIWQTPTDLDTTALIKYISQMDKDVQKKWWVGETALEILKKEDRAAMSSTRKTTPCCEYYIAYNPPITADEEIRISTWYNSRGNYQINETHSEIWECVANSKDEFLEKAQWTTDDYRAMLAYLQVKNENLGWFSQQGVFGWIGESILRQSAKEIHDKTWNTEIRVHFKSKNARGEVTQDETTSQTAVYSYNPGYTTSNDDRYKHYHYYGKKYSVKYLIENDIVKFDANDEAKNNSMKERFKYVYMYGNFAVANLTFPLELEDEETISERIAKHFGEQMSLKYTPPDPPDDDDDDVYGKVSASATYHYGTDLKAESGDAIYAPISGLCKVNQRDYRGFEYSICTSYNGNEFDFTKEGFLIKISCSGTSYISVTTPNVVAKGQMIGAVAHNIRVNYETPKTDNDSNNEDIYSNKQFPCSSGTTYSEIGSNEFNIPAPEYDHIHIEMYKLPCDFTNVNDIEKNVLAPELFFDYSSEIEE